MRRITLKRASAAEPSPAADNQPPFDDPAVSFPLPRGDAVCGNERCPDSPSPVTAETHNACKPGVLASCPLLAKVGTLYLVSLPIGNPDDISLRALRVLRGVDCIAVENLAVSRQWKQWHITARLIRYGSGWSEQTRQEVLTLLRAGRDVALVCDAGTPGIADPCCSFLRAALEQNTIVTAVPGPAAVLAALTASGLATERFVFDGFPPVDREGRRRFFHALAREQRTIVLYETAARLRATLIALQHALGPERPFALACRLTQAKETWLRGTLQDALRHVRSNPPRGEYTLVIAGCGHDF